MPCTLRIRDDVSIADIESLNADHLVKVTPHVGNWTPARLILPTLGISILCVDRTIGAKDRNAHPQLLIRDGFAQRICDAEDRLTTHAATTTPTKCGAFKVGTSLSQVHVGTLRTLFPNASIVTHSEHLEATRDITLAVLEEATAESRSMTWWRKVDREGVVTQYRSRDLPKTWDQYKYDIFGLTNPNEGWLIHNRISILMDIILQSRMGTESRIYHLSGPDMVRYLGTEMEAISRLYDRVRARFAMPAESVEFNLIPFASFRFATRPAQAKACEGLCVGLYDGWNDEQLRSLVHEASDIRTETETMSYFTQHDCVKHDAVVRVPEIARDWSMAYCAAMLARVRDIASRSISA